MENLTKKVVKKKKLQLISNNLAILIPKKWASELDWNRKTQLILEFLPHRQIIILSKQDVEASPVSEGSIPSDDGECQKCGGKGCEACDARKLNNDEEVSDIIQV